MTDVTVGSLDEFPSAGGGTFVGVREGLGVTAFGISVERWPPRSRDYPEHDERASGQEEVYTALAGSATLVVGAERFELRPGVFARVGPAEQRRFEPGPDGVTLLCLGGGCPAASIGPRRRAIDVHACFASRPAKPASGGGRWRRLGRCYASTASSTRSGMSKFA